jgi:hypothetical protein
MSQTVCQSLEEFVHRYLINCSALLSCRTLEGQGCSVEPECTPSPPKKHDMYVNTQQLHILCQLTDSFWTVLAFCIACTAVQCVRNLNTGIWNKHYQLIRQDVSGVLYPYTSDKTDAQKSEISTEINVCSYRRAHTCVCARNFVMCTDCFLALNFISEIITRLYTEMDEE